MDRRRFLEAAGTAGAAAALRRPLSAAAAAEARPAGARTAPSFELGICSYTFREFPLETAIELAARTGLRRIAFKSVHVPLEAADGEVRAATDRARAAGLEPYACGVVYMTSEAETRNAFRYARAGGMGLIVGVPDHELLPLADSLCRETGIRLAIHNHGPGDRLYPTAESVVARIGALGPNVGLCLDVGHEARAGRDPAAAAERFAGRLLDVHVKDETASTAAGEPVEIGKGVVRIGAVLETLLRIGYAGTVAFEHEKDGPDPLPGLMYSLGYVQGVLGAAMQAPARDPRR